MDDSHDFELPTPKIGRLHEAILEDPISQLNPPAPIVHPPTATIADAVRDMRRRRFGSVLVVDAGRLVGIFTERDLVRTCLGREAEIDSRSLAEVMTRDPRSVTLTDTLALALNRMSVGGYRHLPVIDDGSPVGVISVRGILRYLRDNCFV